ncbi:MAG: B12-binding domain-containing radical SAM protein [Eubacteriaceae bacterium]|nr:B12-binding domain-containing radical SAM protein [Eubacteriaceae bacterium]
MKKILLIYPYFFTGIRKDQMFPPLGIALLSAILKKRGLEVMKLDCTFLTEEEAAKIAKEFRPDITGIYVMATLANNAVELLARLKKENPESLYVTGGPLPTLYPERFSQRFDYVFKGEAAKSFPDFCTDFFSSSSKNAFIKNIHPEKYPGIYSRTMGFMDEPSSHLTKTEIDSLPVPDKEGFDHEKYQELSLQHDGSKKSSIMMTYGCPFSCDFCSKPIFGNQVRFRSIDRIMEEIQDILSYGYDSLWIADDLFTLDPNFLISFCNALIHKKIQITWSCLSRADSVTNETSQIMKRSGCSKVYLGIESGNDNILKKMNKKINTTTVRNGVEMFRKHGIGCAGFFIVGYPGETVETIEETFRFALSLDLEEISFNVPYPLPGSKLYARLENISAADWTMENETTFLYKSEFDEGWLKKRILETYETFKNPDQLK